MPKIDIDNYIEQSGICARRALTAMTSELRTLRQENDALRRHAQGLVMQNQTLSARTPRWPGRWISCKATAPISKRSSPP